MPMTFVCGNTPSFSWESFGFLFSFIIDEVWLSSTFSFAQDFTLNFTVYMALFDFVKQLLFLFQVKVMARWMVIHLYML